MLVLCGIVERKKMDAGVNLAKIGDYCVGICDSFRKLQEKIERKTTKTEKIKEKLLTKPNKYGIMYAENHRTRTFSKIFLFEIVL